MVRFWQRSEVPCEIWIIIQDSLLRDAKSGTLQVAVYLRDAEVRMKFYGGVESGPRTDEADFSDNPVQDPSRKPESGFG